MIILGVTLLILACSGYTAYKWINSRTFQLFGELIPRVDTDKKAVALTFDDGPNEKTDEILRLLDQNNVKTTFFLIGQEMEKHPQEGKKLVQAGHEIGNHTYSHKRMIFKPSSFIQSEIERTDALIRESGYTGKILFRPPYGKKLFGLPYYLNEHDRTTIMWDIEPETYPEIAKDPLKIVQYVSDNVQPGSIILIHPWYYSSEDLQTILNGVISDLKEKGYTFETVSELIKKE